MLARDEDILKAAEDWRRAGRGVALATVVETWAQRRGRSAPIS
jgi:xanthine/CO dehydrogenase XdhC/CoxF family maturation factor